MQNSSSEHLGNLPHPSEAFGSVPHGSAVFGNIPKDSEPFRIVRHVSERTENHTLTVREVTRMFEEAGVTRTERSIVNWCRSNRQGISRLDAFFDENERRYLVTPQSVTRAIAEEKAKQSVADPSPQREEKDIPKRAEDVRRDTTGSNDRVRELEMRNRDLEITTRAKDYFIEQLKGEREEFVEKLVEMSRHVGELETQMLQLDAASSSDHNATQPLQSPRPESSAHNTADESQYSPTNSSI